MGIRTKKSLFNRSNLRDIVLLCSFVSTAFFRITETEMIIGFFLLAIGCFLHVLAKGILIRNVVLCNRGIYGLVRHPYYLSNYLVDSSFCLLCGNPFLLLAYPFLFFWSYGPTMRKEEALLAAEHGDQFAKYGEIAQIFPNRGSFARLGTIFDGFSVRRITWKERARVARFCSVGIFITLIHGLTVNGLSKLHLVNLLHYDPKDALFALVAIVCYIASFVFIRMAKRNGHVTEYLLREQ